MTRVGIRELRQRASELLRRVEAGETFEVTDRGRPVAILGPLPDGSPYERMLASGEIIPAEGSIDDLPDPLPPEPGRPTASETLAELRRDER